MPQARGPGAGAMRGIDLGPLRGGQAGALVSAEPGEGEPPGSTLPPEPAPVAEIEVTLSAETKAEIPVGGLEKVLFRLELTSEAVPLAVSQPAPARPDMPIVVSLSVENEALAIDGDTEFTLDPPASQKPRQGFFLVRGVRAGVSRLSVTFRQGGSELGVIGLTAEVVDGAVRAIPAQGSATAAPRDFADDDKLALLVEQRQEGGQFFYDYILHSEALGLPYRRLRSKPLLDRGGGARGHHPGLRRAPLPAGHPGTEEL